MAKTTLTLRQMDRAYCALEKRRDAIRKQSHDARWSTATRFALAKASDALTDALNQIQTEA